MCIQTLIQYMLTDTNKLFCFSIKFLLKKWLTITRLNMSRITNLMTTQSNQATQSATTQVRVQCEWCRSTNPITYDAR
jgi:hypothetical protein